MTQTSTTDYVKQFIDELDKIDKLEQTPKLIKETAIASLKSAAAQSGLNHTTKIQLENKEKMLENISDISLADNFRVIYAQMCVLAVSSLEALLKRYFENMLNHPDNINHNTKKLENLKVSLAELLENKLKFNGRFGNLVVEKASLKFQDLQTIKRNFTDYTTKLINLDKTKEKELCFYLEIRHILVHKGGVVDDKFVNATNSFGANLKNYKVGDHVELNSSDWQKMKDATKYLVIEITRHQTVEENEP